MSESEEITVIIPNYLFCRLDALAKSLEITMEEAVVSVLGASMVDGYLNQLDRLANDLQQARRQRQ